MKSQMTAFAFAGKCGWRAAAHAGDASRWSRYARASEPQPRPLRRRNSRRCKGRKSARSGRGVAGVIGSVSGAARSIDVKELVEAEQHVAAVGQRGVEGAAIGLLADVGGHPVALGG